MVFEDNALELLKQGESEQQKEINSYSNYDLKSPPLVSPAPAQASVGTKLRQNEDGSLCSGDVTEDDHGKKFISDDDEFFEVPAAQGKKKRKAATMMEAQSEILQESDSYEEYKCYDGSTATMETYEEFKESTFAAEEVQYNDEFTDYTYDASPMY